MGNPTPSKASFARKLFLVWLAISNPAKFSDEQKRDDEIRADLPRIEELSDIEKVRNALGLSFLLVACSGVFGSGLGWLLDQIVGPASPGAISAFQIVGVLILLWATIAVRGNEIETWDTVTLTERVNRWIFQGLYFVGTTLLVLSVSW